MRELGDAHEAAHREVGAAASGLDLLIVVDGGPGGAAKGIADGACDAGLDPVADPRRAADVPEAVETRAIGDGGG